MDRAGAREKVHLTRSTLKGEKPWKKVHVNAFKSQQCSRARKMVSVGKNKTNKKCSSRAALSMSYSHHLPELIISKLIHGINT